MTYNYDADDRLGFPISTTPDGQHERCPVGITNTYDFENHLITHGGVTVVYDGDGSPRERRLVAGVTTNVI